MTRPGPLVLLQLVAFWPVWRWYAARLADGSDEPFGVLALATALVFVYARGSSGSVSDRALVLSGAAAALYALAGAHLSPLPRAGLALAAMAPVLSSARLGRLAHVGVAGLLVLSLPVVASLQFYAGWPVRLVTAKLASVLISAAGWPVTASGTCLVWAGDLISVDAPCAGIKMLWTGLYLNFALACFGGLDTRRTLLAWSVTTALVFTGNVLRTVLLFFVESRLAPLPAGGHAAVGTVVFALVALGIAGVHGHLSRRIACVR